MAEKRQRINVNIYRASHNAEESQYIFDVEEELKKLPKSPGVYIMHSKNDDILYVGKAVSLHSRVRQYFQTGHGHGGSAKIAKMVSQIAYFEYIVTSSEMEALVLECNLIKEYRPKYNTMMTDDKGYPYIRVTVEEAFPRFLYSHSMKRDHSKYFGPYTNARAVKDILELINKLYHLRTCNRRLPQDIGKDRPCLYYQIGQCKAPCNGKISQEDYGRQVQAALSFLNGNYKEILTELQEQMRAQAEEMEFEKAAETRDLIESIRHIEDKQQMNKASGEDRDVIACASNDKDIVVTVFFVRDGKLLGRENHHMNGNMKKIEVITRPEKLVGLKEIFATHNCQGMTCLSVMGCGRQKGYLPEMNFTGDDINLLPKIMVFVVVEDDQIEEILADIATAIGTGKNGDGKVFVTEVLDAMRIRTNEREIASFEVA